MILHPATRKQFEDLRVRYAAAEIAPLPSGAALVTIPGFRIPPGWSAATTTVRFIVPVGYPGPHPDCFWADPGLRLANGEMPRATNETTEIPEVNIKGLWFSWHVVGMAANWHPNRDTLSTYVSIIGERFRKPE